MKPLNGSTPRGARKQLACDFDDATPLAQALTLLFDALEFYAKGNLDGGMTARLTLRVYGRQVVGTPLREP